jgi:N utilization substance protein A
MVVNELRGEKIDIVPFSEDLADFVAKALSPAKVKEVIISDDGTQADVIVPDHQLSLAIGKEGQNARLAARLTGVRIDIRGETQPVDGLDDEGDYEEGEWVQNVESGAMEWHAADGTVLTQDQWTQQAAEAEAAMAEGGAPAAAAPDETVVEQAVAETVEAETVEAETVEAETVEAETVEAETVEEGGDNA